jgi:hypothetical protein
VSAELNATRDAIWAAAERPDLRPIIEVIRFDASVLEVLATGRDMGDLASGVERLEHDLRVLRELAGL